MTMAMTARVVMVWLCDADADADDDDDDEEEDEEEDNENEEVKQGLIRAELVVYKWISYAALLNCEHTIAHCTKAPWHTIAHHHNFPHHGSLVHCSTPWPTTTFMRSVILMLKDRFGFW